MKICKIAALVMACTLAVGTAAMPNYSEEYSFAVTASAETVKKLPAPENFKAAADDGKVTLSWDKVDGADAYRIYQYDAAAKKFVKIKTIKSTKSTVSGLTNNTKYYFKVAAVVKSGKSYKAGTISEKISATPKKAAASTVKKPEKKVMKPVSMSTAEMVGMWEVYDFRSGKNYILGQTYNPEKREFPSASFVSNIYVADSKTAYFGVAYSDGLMGDKVSLNSFKFDGSITSWCGGKYKIYSYGEDLFLFLQFVNGDGDNTYVFKYNNNFSVKDVTEEQTLEGEWKVIAYCGEELGKENLFVPSEMNEFYTVYLTGADVNNMDDYYFEYTEYKTGKEKIYTFKIEDYKIYEVNGEILWYYKWVNDGYYILKKI